MTPLQRGQLMSDEVYLEAIEQYGDEFDARMGAEAVRDLLAGMGPRPPRSTRFATIFPARTPRRRSSGCRSA